jgi:hypothetical protein
MVKKDPEEEDHKGDFTFACNLNDEIHQNIAKPVGSFEIKLSRVSKNL